MTPTLLVKVTCAADAAERANQGLTVAAAGCAAGARVSLWLTGEAAWWAVPGKGPDLGLEHARPVEELLALVLELGEVTLCSQCAERRGITADDVRPGIRIAGAGSFVEEALNPGVQALVY
ncbi:MAG: DsrE family protein [Actinomycetota bacterium]|nr:DsrE family protein [Actinomycetota bacterium]